MTGLFKLMEDPVGIIIAGLVLVLVIKELYELFQWWRNRFDDYHQKENKKENLTQQLSDIACTSQEHTETLKEFAASIESIDKTMQDMRKEMNEKFDEIEQRRNEDKVVSGRASLYHLYEILKDKDQLTLSEYETFSKLADQYLEANGNGAFKKKIIPEILNKKVSGDI